MWRVMGALAMLLASASFFASVVLIVQIRHEGGLRQAQFCQLIVKQHQDRVTRLNSTLKYLQTDVGRQRTGLNEYIRRISLPQTRAEVKREAALLPPVCLKNKK